MYCKKMEGKSVILSLLIMSLVVMVQIKVEARVCCPSQQSRNAYTACLIVFSRSSCLRASGCLEISGNVCPSGYPNDILENSGKSELIFIWYIILQYQDGSKILV